MSKRAAIKQERGTKRTCQNPDCGARFYDLNREPVTCPTCQTIYAVAAQQLPQLSARGLPRPFRKPAPFVPDEPKQETPAEDGTELGTLEDEEASAPADDNETFIEEVDEESPDMAGLVDAPADDDEKQ
jgi:hypothetical protein